MAEKTDSKKDRQNTMRRELDISLKDFHDIVTDSDYQREFQRSIGTRKIIVDEWDATGGEYDSLGQHLGNPVACAKFERKRALSFETPLKLPKVLKAIIGDSTKVRVEQYVVYIEGEILRFWSDAATAGIPLSDHTGIQYGFVVTPVSASKCCFELTARSFWIGGPRGGIEALVVKQIHTDQKVSHKAWPDYLMQTHKERQSGGSQHAAGNHNGGNRTAAAAPAVQQPAVQPSQNDHPGSQNSKKGEWKKLLRNPFKPKA